MDSFVGFRRALLMLSAAVFKHTEIAVREEVKMKWLVLVVGSEFTFSIQL